MHVSGHLYFTLKDSRSAVACVCFRANAQLIPFRPNDGMNGGRPRLHPAVRAAGPIPALRGPSRAEWRRRARARRRAVQGALSAEGLFDARRKRALPLLPRRVVVVTSRSGAALRDVCTVIARRAPCIGMVLSPATVQGEGAVETLVSALQRADRVRDADAILLVRGGGSLEDLMAFNNEPLARAIRATRLPVVAGVGHETDTTVADLAADRRAATPSAAAELVAPSVSLLRRDVAARRCTSRAGHQRIRRGATEPRADRVASPSSGAHAGGVHQAPCARPADIPSCGRSSLAPLRDRTHASRAGVRTPARDGGAR